MAIDFAYILLKFLYIADKRTDFVIYYIHIMTVVFKNSAVTDNRSENSRVSIPIFRILAFSQVNPGFGSIS